MSDDRATIKVGDIVAAKWFDDPTMYTGTIHQNDDGKLCISLPVELDRVTAAPEGVLDDAHLVKLVLSKEAKDALVNRILDDIRENLYSYEKWILTVMTDHVRTWSADEMQDFLGITPEEEADECDDCTIQSEETCRACQGSDERP